MAAPSQTFERLPGKAGGLPDLVSDKAHTQTHFMIID
jgi:hypothetical protein